jgi:hypothetical protein
MPSFDLAQTVSGNVKALRRALGSVSRELSRDDLADLINAEHPSRKLNGSTVARWEATGDDYTEPDLQSVWIMSKRANVSMEDFAAVKHALPRGVALTPLVPVAPPAVARKAKPAPPKKRRHA